MIDRALLARYLRQRAELGERELMLEGMTAKELVAALKGAAAAPSPAAAAIPAEADAGTRRHGDAGTGTAASPSDLESRAAAARPAALDAAARTALIREALTRGDVASAAGKVGYAGEPASAASPTKPALAREAAIPVSPRPRVPVSAAPHDPAEARESTSPAASALQVLSMEVAACTACRLASAGRRQTVFGRGDPAARLVVVGEAPGQEEDRTGLPFVGPAGKLLDLLLLTAGFPRDSAYICNTLKCRPPQNRNPLPDELAACAHFLKAQLTEIRPKVLLAIGKFAAQTLAGSEASISSLRGRLFRYEGIPLVVSYHPAYLLRNGSAIRTVWEDFQLARKVLDEQA